MSSDYGKRQAALDKGYADSFATPEAQAWIKNLSHEDRKRLEAQGLLKPMLDRMGSTMRDEDASESSDASTPVHRASTGDSLEAILTDYPELEAAIEERFKKMNGGSNGSEILRKLALLFIDQGRRALNADCLAFVSGLTVRSGESGTILARKHGISRQAFHKRCSELRIELGLPPTRSMKSKKARDSYRESNRRWSSRLVN